MRVLITGSTGMVGKGVLYTCLDDADISSVVTISRARCGVEHEKLTEIIHKDFFDLKPIESELTGIDACYFCLGVSSAGMSEEKYKRLTYDLTMNMANTLHATSANMVFCYVSGAGTDDTQKSRIMWSRVKGKTEADLRDIGFKATYAFRPGFIQPMRGIRSKTKWYQFFYTILKPFSGLLKRAKKYVTDTDSVGFAMIEVTKNGYHKSSIESIDINLLATKYGQTNH